MKKRTFFWLCFLWVSWGMPAFAEEKMPSEELIQVQCYPATGEDRVYFRSPTALVVDGLGSVYVLDNNYGKIFKMSAEGKFVREIGRRGQGPGDLYWPIYMEIKGDCLFVADNLGVSIFSLDGRFIQKFRLFKGKEGIAPYQDKVAVFEIGKNSLFTLYQADGKRLLEFGQKYQVDYKIFKGYSDRDVDSMIHRGKLVTDQESFYYLCYGLGEISKYDKEGKLVKKVKLDGLNNEWIQGFIRTFFVKGRTYDPYPKRGSGVPICIFDALCLEEGIFIMTQGQKDSRILVYDRQDFKLLKEYTYKIKPCGESEWGAPDLLYACQNNVGTTDFYLLCGGDDVFFVIKYKK